MASPDKSRLVYGFVARDPSSVLAEYSAIQGNFRSIAVECLQNVRQPDEKFTITCDGYTFNYLVASGYTFLGVADEAYGRQIPFAFLERMRDAFLEKFAEKGRTAAPQSLDKTFGPVIKREMDYCMQHPEEISKTASIHRKVDEVKGIMVQNVESVLNRGERLDVLVDRTEDLRDQAQKFQRQGQTLRKKMWWNNMKVKILIISGVILAALIIFLIACFAGGKNCVNPNKGGGGANKAYEASPTLIPGEGSGGGSSGVVAPPSTASAPTLMPGASVPNGR